MDTQTDSESLAKHHNPPPPKDKDEDEVNEKVTGSGLDSPPQQPKPQDEDAQPPPRDIHGWKWVVVILAIYSSQFLFALDNTIVANVQPVIVEHFDSVGKLSWLSVAFLMGAAGTNLAWGKVYGQFNAKWTYILCVLVFEIGSAICGAAPTIDSFIIGRAIAGVSGAGMYVGLMSMIAFTTSLKERPLYIGGAGLTWGVGTVLGPIIGGAFTDSSAGWRWAFYINLVVGGACAPVYLFMLPNKDPRPGVSLRDRAHEMDYVGGILMVGAFVSFIMAISFGGVAYPWRSGEIIGLFCCSGVLFIILGVQQVWTIFTTVTRRICPIEFFGSRTVLILFVATAAGGTSIFLPIYMAPIFFQFTRGDSALESGVRLLPFIMLMVFAVIANGALLSSHGLYMPWYTVGGTLVAIGGGLMFTVGVTTSVANVYGYTVLIGFGVGLFCQASFSVAQAVVAPEMIASSVGFISTAQIFGITIALAIANGLFLNESASRIQAIIPDVSTSVIEQTIAGARSEFFQSLSPSLREQVLEIIVNAQSKTYVLVITAGSLVFVLSLLMKRERLFVAPSGAGA